MSPSPEQRLAWPLVHAQVGWAPLCPCPGAPRQHILRDQLILALFSDSFPIQSSFPGCLTRGKLTCKWKRYFICLHLVCPQCFIFRWGGATRSPKETGESPPHASHTQVPRDAGSTGVTPPDTPQTEKVTRTNLSVLPACCQACSLPQSLRNQLSEINPQMFKIIHPIGPAISPQ